MRPSIAALLLTVPSCVLITSPTRARADIATYETVTFTGMGDIDARGSFTFNANPQPYRHFPDATYPIGVQVNYLEFGGVNYLGGFYQPMYLYNEISSTYDGSIPNGPGNGYALILDYSLGRLSPYFVATLASNPGYLYFDDPVDVSISYSTVTPEPSSFALLGTGLLGAVGVLKRRPA